MSNSSCKLFVISGPSGSGKSTIISELFKRMDNLYFSISATTRRPRAGEQNGVDYFFLTHEEFTDKIAKGDFLEYVEYVGNFYGTPRQQVINKLESGFDVILDIEVQGASLVRSKMTDSISVFVMPPRFSELVSRLRKRSTDSDEVIARRIETARLEYSQAKAYDFIVINDDVETAVEELVAIITAERCRAANRIGYADTMK